MNARGWLSLTGLLGAALVASPAVAAEQAAIVESVRGEAVGVQPLDHLPAGKVIRLGPRDEIVLDYPRSCTREIISGGTVTVGTTGSNIAGGRVESGKVLCDNQNPLASERKGDAPDFTGLPKPRGQPGETGIGYTLYGRSPLFDLGGPGQLTIERLDQPGETIKLDIAASELLRGTFYDFAKTDHSLTAGAVYRATFGGRRIVFWVDALAEAGDTPLLGRLLRL
jgi:hypothetical protein